MAPRTEALDRPSLTLPNWRTALKRKLKRPKLPKVDKTALVLSIFNLWWGVDDWLKGRYGAAITYLVICGCWWGIAFYDANSSGRQIGFLSHMEAVYIAIIVGMIIFQIAMYGWNS